MGGNDHPAVLSPASLAERAPAAANPYQEGMVAGLLGAAVIALWFLVLDALTGRPLYTPTVLGTLLFRHGQLGQGPGLATLTPSLEMVLMFTWVHALVFLILGVGASWLIRLAETNPHFGFGLLLFSVFFEFGFLAVAMIFAEPVLHVMTWPSILIGNLLAFAVMAAYFRRHHRTRTMWP